MNQNHLTKVAAQRFQSLHPREPLPNSLANQMKKPSFKQFQFFLQSWGLLPMHEVCYTNGTIASTSFGHRTVINQMVLGRMKVECVLLFGKDCLDFLMEEMGCINGGEFYLTTIDWKGMKEKFLSFFQ